MRSFGTPEIGYNVMLSIDLSKYLTRYVIKLICTESANVGATVQFVVAQQNKLPFVGSAWLLSNFTLNLKENREIDLSDLYIPEQRHIFIKKTGTDRLQSCKVQVAVNTFNTLFLDDFDLKQVKKFSS